MTDPIVDGIAIIGMAGRFPGAPDVATLWDNLCAGVESIGPFSDADLRAAGVDTSDPAFVNSGGAMDDIEAFDAPFFGMSRREAELTDPQHRVLLETVWTALEDAGIDPTTRGRRVGIFGGVSENGYLRYNLMAHPDVLARYGQVPVLLASAREYAITRAAYKLDLTGPAVAVITACSTSAVAVHLAVQSLLAGDSDVALAGGAYINHPLRGGYIFQEGSILSEDGHVRAFDADAGGTVMASGIAFVVLKPLARALEDDDRIYAVIRGSAINNDGAARVGFTAPSLDGQRAVVEDALAVADVDADSIGMLEAHGTGTSLGDPIEVAALTLAYRRDTEREQYCAIGSLKSNIGHLDAAAGVAGLIKAALSLYHGRIPPSINFRAPNPQIDFAASPFYVNTELSAWERGDRPRRAGVSAFGFGGTNAHIVLEEAPQPAQLPQRREGPPHVLALSTRSADALERASLRLADHLAAHPEVDLADVASTLALGRVRMPHRRAVVAYDREAAIGLLREDDPAATAENDTAQSGTRVAFLFTGQGAQYAGMGAALYRSEPVFRAAIDDCSEALGELDGHRLTDLLYGDDLDADAADARILQTGVGQPAIFAVQIALARLLASWGIEPAAMVGHSVGEIAAACIGGVFSLEDALRLAALRGQLMQDLPRGAMTAVLADASVVLPRLDEQTSLAAVNAPLQCVASGPPASIERLEEGLAADGIRFRRLATDRAFHSPMMEPARAPLGAQVERLAHGPSGIPVVSTLTGGWVSGSELADPGYWSEHARRTVRFADAVGVLLTERPELVLMEVGPGETLASLVRQHPALSPDSVVISTLPHRGTGGDDAVHARRALAGAWAAGVDVDWVAAQGGRRRHVSLPTYPFARERYWIDALPSAVRPEAGPAAQLAASASPVAPLPATSMDAPRPGALVAAPTSSSEDRRSRITARITAILVDLSGLDPTALDVGASFTSLGFDSLFLTQANARFRKEFGVRVTLGQLLGETPTVEALAARMDAELPADALPPPAPLPAVRANTAPPRELSREVRAPIEVVPSRIAAWPGFPTDGSPGDPIGWLITEQLRVMDEQLDLMRAYVEGLDGHAGVVTSDAPPLRRVR
jgi:phthiocerol/phenolphthiocerol synthesis type-I polyketide synthase E